MVTNLGHIAAANSQIEKYKKIADDQEAYYLDVIKTVSARLPETRFEVEKVDAIVAVPPTPEPPAEGGGEGSGEPTDGGVK